MFFRTLHALPWLLATNAPCAWDAPSRPVSLAVTASDPVHSYGVLRTLPAYLRECVLSSEPPTDQLFATQGGNITAESARLALLTEYEHEEFPAHVTTGLFACSALPCVPPGPEPRCCTLNGAAVGTVDTLVILGNLTDGLGLLSSIHPRTLVVVPLEPEVNITALQERSPVRVVVVNISHAPEFYCAGPAGPAGAAGPAGPAEFRGLLALFLVLEPRLLGAFGNVGGNQQGLTPWSNATENAFRVTCFDSGLFAEMYQSLAVVRVDARGTA
jgi:hypothetical protein